MTWPQSPEAKARLRIHIMARDYPTMCELFRIAWGCTPRDHGDLRARIVRLRQVKTEAAREGIRVASSHTS